MLIFVQIIGKVMSQVKGNIPLAILNTLKFKKINLCLIIMSHAM